MTRLGVRPLVLLAFLTALLSGCGTGGGSSGAEADFETAQAIDPIIAVPADAESAGLVFYNQLIDTGIDDDPDTIEPDLVTIDVFADALKIVTARDYDTDADTPAIRIEVDDPSSDIAFSALTTADGVDIVVDDVQTLKPGRVYTLVAMGNTQLAPGPEAPGEGVPTRPAINAYEQLTPPILGDDNVRVRFIHAYAQQPLPITITNALGDVEIASDVPYARTSGDDLLIVSDNVIGDSLELAIEGVLGSPIQVSCPVEAGERYDVIVAQRNMDREGPDIQPAIFCHRMGTAGLLGTE
jgi:hypothetical protein